MWLTANLSTEEFLRSRDFPELASRLVDVPAPHVVSICRLAFEVQKLRDRFGPVKITSGYRPPALNQKVNGASSSAHLVGRACDISFMRTPAKTAWLAISEGMMKVDFDRIAYYRDGNRFHIEIAEDDAQPAHRLYIADPNWRQVTPEQAREL